MTLICCGICIITVKVPYKDKEVDWAPRVCNLVDCIADTKDRIKLKTRQLNTWCSLLKNGLPYGEQDNIWTQRNMSNINSESGKEIKDEEKEVNSRQMTPREKRATRKRWRENSATYRQRQKTAEAIPTPPGSPEHDAFVEPEPVSRRSDAQRRVVAQKRKNEKAKCYRSNAQLKIKLVFQEWLMEKYKKRYNRLKMKDTEDKGDSNMKRKTTRVLTKSYILYKTIIENIKQRYHNARSNRDRRFIASLVTRRQILKQYKLHGHARRTLLISRWHMEMKPLRQTKLSETKVKGDNTKFL